VSGPERDDWDAHRLDAAFQARFDQPAPPHLRERIVQEIAASTTRAPLMRSFRAVTRTAVAAIAIFVAVIATIGISGISPTLPTASLTTPATATPTTPPLIGTVGAPFPSSIRPSGSDATYAVLSVADAAAIRDRGVDDREIAVAGWYQPPRPIPCPLLPDAVQPLEDCALITSWLLPRTDLLDPGPIGAPSVPMIKPVTAWQPSSTASIPAAVVFVGHFDDSRAAQCPAGERRVRCQDRFVVDIVAWDDGPSLDGFPTEIAGLPVISMSQAIVDRETDLSGQLAIAGWYQESSPVSCPALPSVAVEFLEGSCAIPLTWFLEAPESIIDVIQTATSTQFGGSGPLGPAINPVFPTVPPPLAHPLPNQGGSTPTQAILIGHFNDSRASLCSQDAPQVCLGRFVVDAVPWVEGVERALPERTDSRDPGGARPPIVDLFEVVGRVASIRSVLNVAAVGPDELVRLWPVFDLTAASHSKGDSFWIVTVITDDIGDGSASTFVVDAAGSLFQVTGNTFAVLDPGSPHPS